MERYASVGSIKPNGHVFQMSFSTLKFPPSLLASAIECEGVARLAGRSLKLEESSDVISLSLGRSLFTFTTLTVLLSLSYPRRV